MPADDGRDDGDVTTLDDHDSDLDGPAADEAATVEEDPIEPVEGAAVAEDTEAADPVEAQPVEAGHDLRVPAVATRPSRRRQREEIKASARKVRRVLRRVDPWSVFKVASLFIAALWAMMVLASLLVWRAAVSSGSVDNTEDFIRELGFDEFNFDPQQMFESLLSAGAVVAIAAVFFTVLLAVLFNLVCDITGGVRIVMIEQDLVDRPSEPSS